jgi:hypothetical protein
LINRWTRQGVIQHGWVEVSGTFPTSCKIIDPTRWVFEAKAPYIYEGASDYYDIGGNKFRMAMLGPCPEFDKKKTLVKLEQQLGDDEAWKFLQMLTGGRPEMDTMIVHWLANQDPREFGEFAPAFFKAIQELGLKALIPIDNWEFVMGWGDGT